MALDILLNWLPLALALALGGLLLRGTHWLLLGRRPDLNQDAQMPRQLLLGGLGLVVGIVVILSLPLSEDLRKQILALFGVLISAVVAFSSTTMTANFMAGLMLRITRPFKVGDFIQVGPHFGRVFQRGLFDTDIQTEQRQIIALPHMFLVQNPITVTHSSGTIISAEVSLGYEVHNETVEAALRGAAEEAGLRDGFIQILRLDDHAVVYRVSGVLENVKSLLSTRSALYRAVLNHLHAEQIEITSPGFMVQRPEPEPVARIPKAPRRRKAELTDSGELEAVVFDKAEEAATLHERRERLEKMIKKTTEAQAEATEEESKAKLDKRLEQLKAALDEVLQAQKKEKESN